MNDDEIKKFLKVTSVIFEEGRAKWVKFVEDSDQMTVEESVEFVRHVIKDQGLEMNKEGIENACYWLRVHLSLLPSHIIKEIIKRMYYYFFINIKMPSPPTAINIRFGFSELNVSFNPVAKVLNGAIISFTIEDAEDVIESVAEEKKLTESLEPKSPISKSIILNVG
jgi:hypothetical protein